MAPGEMLEQENKTGNIGKVLTVDDVPEATKEEAENIKNEANELFKGDETCLHKNCIRGKLPRENYRGCDCYMQ